MTLKIAKRFYLSGPMEGLPKHNFPEFHRICRLLRAAGHHIYNPAEDHEGPKDWKYYMMKDIRIMLNLSLDGIILMPGWKQSKGANVELFIAIELLHIPAYEYIEGPCNTSSGVSPVFTLKELKNINWSRSI